MTSNDTKAMATVNLMSKNLGVGVFLTLFFGGFGLLYSNIVLGIIGVVVEIALVIIVVLTFGLGILLLIPWHIISVIISIVCVNKHNRKLLSKM